MQLQVPGTLDFRCALSRFCPMTRSGGGAMGLFCELRAGAPELPVLWSCMARDVIACSASSPSRQGAEFAVSRQRTAECPCFGRQCVVAEDVPDAGFERTSMRSRVAWSLNPAQFRRRPLTRSASHAGTARDGQFTGRSFRGVSDVNGRSSCLAALRRRPTARPAVARLRGRRPRCPETTHRRERAAPISARIRSMAALAVRTARRARGPR